MLSLPSLAPQDSYTLWYTSSTTSSTPYLDAPSSNDPSDPSAQNRNSQHPSSALHRRHLHSRTPLARLRHDEEYMERRKANIHNYGQSWIKPPGLHKTLYQTREEEREMKEHHEALRREALAQELADAEAEGAVDEMLQGDGMEDGDIEEGRDLDDDVPDADADNTGLGDDNSDDNSDTDGDSDEDEDENGIENQGTNEGPRGALAQLATRVPDGVYREALVRGMPDDFSQATGEDGLDAGDASGMLQEEDLAREPPSTMEEDLDMDMDADLDAEIPDGDESHGGYEHTDSDAELTSSEDESSIGMLPRRGHIATSMVRSDGTQGSLDLSAVLSGGSSQIASSSPPRRRDTASGRGGRGWRPSFG